MSDIVDLARVNRVGYRSLQARRQYAKASGYLDKGEEAALSFVIDHCVTRDVLDIGVGGGRTIPIMKQFAENYIGIDYIKEMVNIAAKKFPKECLKVMDARILDFANHSFNLVAFSNNGIDSVGFVDRQRIIRLVHAVLRPQGYFVFSALNYHGRDTTQDVGLRAMLKQLVASPISALNRKRLKKYTIDTGEESIRNLNAHFNGLVATFTTIENQIKQLEHFHFVVERVYDVNGGLVKLGDTAVHSPYVHYVAKKILRPAEIMFWSDNNNMNTNLY